jgi:transposase-like protein
VGRRGYPPEFRRKVLDLVEAGRPIAEVAKALGISDQSIYSWRRQDRIDRGLEPGLTSSERPGSPGGGYGGGSGPRSPGVVGSRRNARQAQSQPTAAGREAS